MKNYIFTHNQPEPIAEAQTVLENYFAKICARRTKKGRNISLLFIFVLSVFIPTAKYFPNAYVSIITFSLSSAVFLGACLHINDHYSDLNDTDPLNKYLARLDRIHDLVLFSDTCKRLIADNVDFTLGVSRDQDIPEGHVLVTLNTPSLQKGNVTFEKTEIDHIELSTDEAGRTFHDDVVDFSWVDGLARNWLEDFSKSSGHSIPLEGTLLETLRNQSAIEDKEVATVEEK